MQQRIEELKEIRAIRGWDKVFCPRCEQDGLVRAGSPIQPPSQVFSLDYQGKITRQTGMQQAVRYPVSCTAFVAGRAPDVHLVEMCSYVGSLTGVETERLLDQIARRTGNPNV